jgi:serine protease Do
VSDVQKFRLLVADTPVKKRVRVNVLREGRPREVFVTLDERPDEMRSRSLRKRPSSSSAGHPALVRRLRERERHQGERGVVVVDVTPGSPADDAGLSRGDVIKEVNDAKVKTVGEYTAALQRAKDRNPKRPSSSWSSGAR